MAPARFRFADLPSSLLDSLVCRSISDVLTGKPIGGSFFAEEPVTSQPGYKIPALMPYDRLEEFMTKTCIEYQYWTASVRENILKGLEIALLDLLVSKFVFRVNLRVEDE